MPDISNNYTFIAVDMKLVMSYVWNICFHVLPSEFSLTGCVVHMFGCAPRTFFWKKNKKDSEREKKKAEHSREIIRIISFIFYADFCLSNISAGILPGHWLCCVEVKLSYTCVHTSDLKNPANFTTCPSSAIYSFAKSVVPYRGKGSHKQWEGKQESSVRYTTGVIMKVILVPCIPKLPAGQVCGCCFFSVQN